MFELILYMVIAAALAATVFFSYQPNSIKARYQADRLKSDLRHMQILAMTWGVTLRMTTAATNYSVACVGSATGPCVASASAPCATSSINDPATGSNFCVALEDATFTAVPATFDLDSLGRPRTAGGALLASDETFTVTGGGVGHSLTVRQLTGFVSGP